MQREQRVGSDAAGARPHLDHRRAPVGAGPMRRQHRPDVAALAQVHQAGQRVAGPDRCDVVGRFRRHQIHHRVRRQQRRGWPPAGNAPARPELTTACTAVRSPWMSSTSTTLIRRPRLRIDVTSCIAPGSGAHRKLADTATGCRTGFAPVARRRRCGRRWRTAPASRRRAPWARWSSAC